MQLFQEFQTTLSIQMDTYYNTVIGLGLVAAVGVGYAIKQYLSNEEFNTPSNIFKGVIIEIKDYNIYRSIKIPDDDPYTLLKTINNDPMGFMEKYGYNRPEIVSIFVVDNSPSLKQLDLMYKVASYLKLDVSNIHSHEQLHKYIENHINFSPPPSHTGYNKLNESYKNVMKSQISQ